MLIEKLQVLCEGKLLTTIHLDRHASTDYEHRLAKARAEAVQVMAGWRAHFPNEVLTIKEVPMAFASKAEERRFNRGTGGRFAKRT